MRRLMVLILPVLLFATPLPAQTSAINRLKQQVAAASAGEKKLQALLSLCDASNSLHPDSLYNYAIQAKVLAQKLNLPKQELWSLFYISSAFTTKGMIDSAMHLANVGLALLQEKKINDGTIAGNFYNQKGRCFMRQNNYKEAIEMGNLVISHAVAAHDELLEIKGKTLIGWAHLEMANSAEALRWHMMAVNAASNTEVLDKYAIIYANIAINYNGLNNIDSAFYFIEKAVAASRKYENLFALSNSLAIKAQLHIYSGEPQKAEEPLKEVVAIRKQIGDPFYITSDMAQLALYYANNGQPARGVAMALEGIAIAKQYELDTKLFFLYSALGENYRLSGDYKSYAGVLEQIIQIKDSIFNSNSAKEVAALQTRYDLKEKEKQIVQHKLELLNKNLLIYFTLLAIVLAAAIVIYLFKKYRHRQKIKMERMMQHEKEQAFAAIKLAEENERKRIAADLHDNMGAYASAISANVDELISGSSNHNLLLQNMKANASEIMHNLRDTIWVLNREEILFTGIADRLKTYVLKISKAYPAITIDIAEEIEYDFSLSPQKALHMLRILQEAFHNAIKHSRCTQIAIQIKSKKTWSIKILDNGVGLDMLHENGSGEGIKNMHLRAQLNKWKLAIETMVPEGTAIQLSAANTIE